MSNRIIPLILCLACVPVFLIPAPLWCIAGEDTALVNVSKANVRSGAGTGYPVVTTIEKNTSVTVLECSGNWCRIKMPRDGHGWIYKKLLTFTEAEPPKQSGGFLSSLKRGFQASRRSEMTAAAGSRGLGEEDSTSMTTDYSAVEKMDAYTIKSGTVKKFIKEGGLSPENMP